MAALYPDHEIEIISKKTDMDFIILVGQILDEFVKLNIHLNHIEQRLENIEQSI